MPTDITRYVPLMRVVSYCIDELEKGDADRDRMWIMAFRGLVVMGIATSWEAKTIRIPVNANKTATIPSDYISWTKIGILNQNGEIATLTVNKSLTKLDDLRPNRLSLITGDVTTDPSTLTANPFYLNYFSGNTYTPLFGAIQNGVISYGDCRVDEANNVIVLSPSFQYSSIVLEYLSSPEKDVDYQIELCLQEALIAFIKWKLKMGSQQEFYAAWTEGRRALPEKRITLQEVNQVIRSAHGFKIKS